MVEKFILLEKATKLYNLIRSDNKNESAVAKSKLDQFLEKNGLTLNDIIENEYCTFEIEKETKYEVYLFNHLLIKSIENSNDLMKKCGMRQLSDTKMSYKLTRYVHTSITFRYEQLLKIYQEDRQEVQKLIEDSNKNNKKVTEEDFISKIYIEGFGMIEFNTGYYNHVDPEPEVFEEELFFISFVRKYNLIPRPVPREKTSEEEIQLTQEKMMMIMKMDKMYRKKMGLDPELEGGQRKLDNSF